jgi:serine protease Do
LNGRQLAVSYSFANNLDTDVQSGNASGGYSGFVEVRDDSGAIKVEVPAEWTDVDGSQFESGGITWAAVQAAPSLQGFNDYTEPGVLFAVSKDIAQAGGYVQMLDGLREAFRPDCDYSPSDRTEYEDSAYEGQYDVFTNCKGTDNVYIVLSARPKENQTAFLLFVLVNIITEPDLNALDQILATFDVVGDLP